MVRISTSQWGFTRPSSIYFSLGIVRDIVPLVILNHKQVGVYSILLDSWSPISSRSFKARSGLMRIWKLDGAAPFVPEWLDLVPTGNLPAWGTQAGLWSVHPSPDRDNLTLLVLFPGALGDVKDNLESSPKSLTFCLGLMPICINLFSVENVRLHVWLLSYFSIEVA